MSAGELSIQIGDVVLADVPTFTTDVLVFSFAMFYAGHLKKLYLNGQSNNIIWFFRLVGVSSLLGGLGHLFRLIVPEIYFQIPAWLILGFAVYNLQQFGIYYIRSESRRVFMEKFIKVQFVLFVLLLFINPVFTVPKYNIAFGFLGIFLPMVINDFRHRKQAYSKFIILAIGLLTISAIWHGIKIDISPKYFEYRSVSHVFVILFLATLYYAMNLKSKTYEAEQQA